MPGKGSVFFNEKTVYRDGTTDEKLFVLLNIPAAGDPYLFVMTTSKKKGKPSTPGCIEDRKPFFIPAKTAFFRLDTWLQLMTFEALDHDHVKRSPYIKRIGEIPPKMADAVVDCLLKALKDDIAPWQEELLKPPIASSIAALKERWARH